MEIQRERAQEETAGEIPPEPQTCTNPSRLVPCTPDCPTLESKPHSTSEEQKWVTQYASRPDTLQLVVFR